MDDHERELWVLNDEPLYHWQRRSGLSMRAFIKENRAELTAYINKKLGNEPEHKGILGDF